MLTTARCTSINDDVCRITQELFLLRLRTNNHGIAPFQFAYFAELHECVGGDGRTRTAGYGGQNPMPYRLATSLYFSARSPGLSNRIRPLHRESCRTLARSHISFQDVEPYAGAGDGNRTRVACVEGRCSTIELHRQGAGSVLAATPGGAGLSRLPGKKEVITRRGCG